MERENPVAQVSDKVIWNYFTVTGDDEFKATCAICARNVSYKFVPELTQHIRDHGEEPKESDVEEFERDVQKKILKRKYKPTVLDYFEVTKDKRTICLLCDAFVSFSFSIINLWKFLKHLQTAHKNINLEETGVAKRICLNGVLYVAANEQELEENEDEVETIEMDPMYLSNDSIDEPTTPSPKEKQPKILLKRNFSKVNSTEPVNSTKNTCSKILEVPRQEIRTTTASIDNFGVYVVSILKELPEPVSDRLQSEIINLLTASP